MFVANHHLCDGSDYREVKYKAMSDMETILRIEGIMADIVVVGGRPIKNTSRHACYQALEKIKCALFDNWMWHKLQDSQKFIEDYKKLYGEDVGKDIQHVGYDEEQCGRTK